MIDATLLELLRCPETLQTLRGADSALLQRLNQQIRAGTLKNRGGQILSQPLAAGLIRADGQWLYPVQDDIPVMLIEQAIRLDS